MENVVVVGHPINNINFRDLKADEIEVRVQQIFDEKGITLLLYKNARVDQIILDEAVGNLNWQKHYSRDNANCIVSIWDNTKKQWIEKEDTGTESFSEAEKGLASDSFKRSCFNWGIGRELYTAPFIWINWQDLEKTEKDSKTGKYKIKDSFEVEKIKIKDKKITCLSIVNKNGKRVFTYAEQILEEA